MRWNHHAIMKPFLKVVSGPSGSGEKFQLQQSRSFTAGRAGSCDAVFAADSLMSTCHFSLTMTPQGFFLEDLGSTNGTFVNGTRVVHCQVHPGEEIRAGSSLFIVALENDAPLPHAAPSVETSPATPRELHKPSMQIVTGNGQERSLTANQRITIGRTELAQWTFPTDPRMSSEHMAIESADGLWQVVDLASSNGTYVNEQRVTRNVLKSGDAITAGSTQFFVTINEHAKSQEKSHSPSLPPPGTAPIADSIHEHHEATPIFVPSKETLVADTPAPTVHPRLRVTMVCVNHPYLSRELEEGQQILIGRSLYADVSVPNDYRMSTEHARVRVLTHEDVLLEDLNSTNGTQVNGTRIQEMPLRHGDSIAIGGLEFCVQFSGRPISVPTLPPPVKQVWKVDAGISSFEPSIPFESFPCGSGLYFYSGCLPSFDPVDIARRLTLATPGWLLQQVEQSGDTHDPCKVPNASTLSVERISPMDPSWMIPWSKAWGQQRSIIIYSRSDVSKIESTFQSLFETLNASSQKFPSHAKLFDFLANRLSDTVQRIFAPLDAILIELYGGKQWAYIAPRELEPILPQLHFRKKHRW